MPKRGTTDDAATDDPRRAAARCPVSALKLPAQALATRCAPAEIEAALADATADQPAEIVGQARARSAIDFGIAMRHAGYHLFVMGPPGSGKRSLVQRAVDAHRPPGGVQRSDWVYVHNFETPHQPIALGLPPGRGTQLRADLRALIDQLRATIPAAFESEEYTAEAARLNTDAKERVEQGLIQVSQDAQAQGLVMVRTPVGFTFAPQKGTEVMSPQDYEALPAPERERLEKAVTALQERLVQAMRETMRLRKEHAQRMRELNLSTTQLAVDHAIDEPKAR